ncbi:hypothetical protein RSK20926_18702 [Roseobacter sp. SK209-2-6]|nr:hypothetical protein RSK20926_18702 [Roseobacter sp. SK209-2-6]
MLGVAFSDIWGTQEMGETTALFSRRAGTGFGFLLRYHHSGVSTIGDDAQGYVHDCFV